MTKLTRREFVAGAGALSAVAVIGRAEAADFTYKLGLELRDDQPLPRRMTEACDKILEASSGRLRIRPFPNAQLGSSQEMLTQLRGGSLEFLTSSFGLLSSVVPVAGMPTLGFIFPGYEQIWPAIDGELGQYIASQVEKQGEMLVVGGVHDLGFRQVTAKRKLLGPNDLAGLRIRTPQSPYLTSLFSALGASPTPMPFGDLYTALQTGLVDGQENPLTLVESFKFNEVQQFCLLTSHTWDGWVPIANRAAWDKLPPDLQAIVTENFNAAAQLQRKDLVELNAATKDKLAASGMEFVTPEVDAFGNALKATNFYTTWKENLGAEAWAVLETSVGKLV